VEAQSLSLRDRGGGRTGVADKAAGDHKANSDARASPPSLSGWWWGWVGGGSNSGFPHRRPTRTSESAPSKATGAPAAQPVHPNPKLA